MSTGQLCAVCSAPLPEYAFGRPRKVCRDEDSPTPGGCERWRDIEMRLKRKGRRRVRTPFTASDLELLSTLTAAGHGYSIE